METGLDEIVRIRREKAQKLADLGWASFPNGIEVKHTAAEVRAVEGEATTDPKDTDPRYRIGGRIMALRDAGKLIFADLYDRTGKMQIQLRKDVVGEETFAKMKLVDIGDIVAVEGPRFLTKKGELTIQVREAILATKSMYPLPDTSGHFGLQDVELRYRERYVDLAVNKEVREVFLRRTKLVRYIRNFLDARAFMEVETPMLHALIGGAAAKPFETHHNALDMKLYCRIAPELYLKRLVVGGFERVYEVNRNFRNEGLSTRHNPEFTMLEFYWAWATYENLMALSEEMMRGAAMEVAGTLHVPYGDAVIDFEKPFARIPVRDGLRAKLPGIDLQDREALLKAAADRKIHLNPKESIGKLQMDLFEALFEADLVQPTFVVDFPVEVSPLARRKNSDPTLTDRFELYIAGREMANGFSELNDPDDQRARFKAQVEAKQGGAAETMDYDEDYCHALEIGMPPTAGEGVGIDRLCMILTNQPSIRDVILFPTLRPEAKSAEAKTE